MCYKFYDCDTSIEKEIENWGTYSILRNIDNGVYICTC